MGSESGRWRLPDRSVVIGFPHARVPPHTRAIKEARGLEEGAQWLQTLAIDELSTYAYRTDRDPGRPIPHLEENNSHLIDALRYAYERDGRLPTKAGVRLLQERCGSGRGYGATGRVRYRGSEFRQADGRTKVLVRGGDAS